MSVARSDGVSAEVLRLQLMKANQRVEVAGAQLAALGAKRVKDDPADLNLLERIAWALISADEACKAVQSVPFDPAGHHTPHPNDRAIPGNSTAAARRARHVLETGFEQVLERWEASKAADFHPTSTRGPSVRCGNRECGAYGKRIPAWDHRGTNEFCSRCGRRLPAPPAGA